MGHNTQINTDWDLMCCAARWLAHSLSGRLAVQLRTQALPERI